LATSLDQAGSGLAGHACGERCELLIAGGFVVRVVRAALREPF